jgi:hypothetical protein
MIQLSGHSYDEADVDFGPKGRSLGSTVRLNAFEAETAVALEAL